MQHLEVSGAVRHLYIYIYIYIYIYVVRKLRVKKEAEILKYEDLTTDIQRMCNVTAKVIPVIIGATGTISKSVQTVPEQRTGKGRNEGTADNSHIVHCTHNGGKC